MLTPRCSRLREMIWKRTLLPRDVRPVISPTLNQPSHGGQRSHYGSSTVPVTFRVNRKSRAVAMRFYQTREHYLLSEAPYVNFEVDNMCISMDDLHDPNGPGLNSYMELISRNDLDNLKVPKADLQKIRYLNVSFIFCDFCICSAALRFYNWYMDWTQPDVDVLKSVKEVTIEVDWKDMQVDFIEIFDRDRLRLFIGKKQSGDVVFYIRET
jgi:2EXR family